MYYIFNSQGQYLAGSDAEPNLDDLATRGEQAVASERIFANPLLVGDQIIERGHRPSDYHEWDGTQWAISDEQQAVKNAEDIAKVRNAINALRDRKINGGVYVPAIDKWIDTDATAERNILSVKATFDLFGDQEIPWTFAANSVAMINKEKLLVIWQALMTNKQQNHANALAHKAAVEKSENPLEYNYSNGWTMTYEEYKNA